MFVGRTRFQVLHRRKYEKCETALCVHPALLLEAAEHDCDMLSLTISDLATKLKMQESGHPYVHVKELGRQNAFALHDDVYKESVAALFKALKNKTQDK